MKVKFQNPITFEGGIYQPGEVYDLPVDKVEALGEFVVKLDGVQEETKAKTAPAKNKMVGSAQVKK